MPSRQSSYVACAQCDCLPQRGNIREPRPSAAPTWVQMAPKKRFPSPDGAKREPSTATSAAESLLDPSNRAVGGIIVAIGECRTPQKNIGKIACSHELFFDSV